MHQELVEKLAPSSAVHQELVKELALSSAMHQELVKELAPSSAVHQEHIKACAEFVESLNVSYPTSPGLAEFYKVLWRFARVHGPSLARARARD